MSKPQKPKKYSNAGKGDKNRISNKKKYDNNYDRIFKPKMLFTFFVLNFKIQIVLKIVTNNSNKINFAA